VTQIASDGEAPPATLGSMIRIANASGFYGDRPSAAREMVEGGPIDVLTGDYLAELTMAILHKSRVRQPGTGYATTFLRQLEEVLGACVERGIRIVSNAGGLNPEGLAEEVDRLAARLGVRARVAYVRGDDLLDRIPELTGAGCALRHMDTGAPFSAIGGKPITANAYLGGFGIAEALGRGADVVVTGRVTDASVVVGPAAWHHGWARNDWDALAGAVVAGHVIECGPQCTGGNYAFFREVPGLERPGFPIAEIHADGSSVITKHPGTGGMVTVGTVTAQLLYEIGGPRYANPDATARFDTIRLAQEGTDRVRIHGVRGEPPPADTKVCLNYLGGYRNGMTFVLTGLDVEEKARLVERTLFGLLGGREQFREASVQLVRSDRPDPGSNEDAFAHLRVIVKDPDPKKVGRAFSNAAVAMTLASYPGMVTTSPPGAEAEYAVYWPTLVPSSLIRHEVVFEGERLPIEPVALPARAPEVAPLAVPLPAPPDGPCERVPLGTLFGARSGDKGGNANLGLWARDPRAYAWLERELDVARFRELVPEARELEVERFAFPNFLALNFVVKGLLGEGVASSVRSDPQAKTLGEYLRARIVPIPRNLLD
jgi:hypothetical protein